MKSWAGAKGKKSGIPYSGPPPDGIRILQVMYGALAKISTNLRFVKRLEPKAALRKMVVAGVM